MNFSHPLAGPPASKSLLQSWLLRWSALLLLLAPVPGRAQSYTNDVLSREVSLFNFGGSSATTEALSREVSVFNEGSYLADATSREVSLFNYGFNHITVAVGSTVVPAGTGGAVPILFSTLAAVTNVQLALDFPPSLLTNWGVLAAAPYTGNSFVSNGSRLFVTFSPINGLPITNTQSLGLLTFLSTSSQPSAFLPLPVAGAAAPMVDGVVETPYKATHDGEVVVLHTYPLLRWTVDTNGARFINLYGYTDTIYSIQATTNLVPPVLWTPIYSSLTPLNYLAVTPQVLLTNPARFYRAKQ